MEEIDTDIFEVLARVCSTISEEVDVFNNKNEDLADEMEKKTDKESVQELKTNTHSQSPLTASVNSNSIRNTASESGVQYDPLYAQIDELFEQFARKRFCFDSMRAVAERCNAARKIEPGFFVPIELFKRAADCLMLTIAEVDIRICMEYLAILHALFMCTLKIPDAMRYFYSLEFRQGGARIAHPQLHDRYKPYYASLKACMTKLTSTNWIEGKEYQTIRNELAFLIMISPRATLRIIVLDLCNKPEICASNMARALRQIPVVSELRLGIQNSLVDCSSSMLTALVYRFLNSFKPNELVQSDLDLNNIDKREQLLNLLFIFTSTYIHMNDKRVYTHLFDPNELIMDFVCQSLQPKVEYPSFHLHFALDLLDKLMNSRVISNRCIQPILRWKYTTEIYSNTAVDVRVLLLDLMDLCMKKGVEDSIKLKCFKLIERLVLIVKEKAEIVEPVGEDKETTCDKQRPGTAARNQHSSVNANNNTTARTSIRGRAPTNNSYHNHSAVTGQLLSTNTTARMTSALGIVPGGIHEDSVARVSPPRSTGYGQPSFPQAEIGKTMADATKPTIVVNRWNPKAQQAAAQTNNSVTDTVGHGDDETRCNHEQYNNHHYDDEAWNGSIGVGCVQNIAPSYPISAARRSKIHRASQQQMNSHQPRRQSQNKSHQSQRQFQEPKNRSQPQQNSRFLPKKGLRGVLAVGRS